MRSLIPASPPRRRTLTAAAVVAGIALTAAAIPAFALSTPTTHTPEQSAAAERGSLLWAQPRRTLNTAQTRTLLRRSEFDADAVANGVRLTRLVYRTVGPGGGAAVASGLVVLPRTGAHTVSPVEFLHGTTSYRNDAPSALPRDEFAAAPAIEYGAAGFVGIAPDYLGLGVGRGPQPWFDVPSETTAALDLLRAARTYVAARGRTLDARVDLTGFSQGASAALGLARALHEGADSYFRVRALAPISGAYALRAAEVPAMLDGQIKAPTAVPYVAYLLVSYNRLHHLYDDPHEVFQARYAERMDTLFNSNVPGSQMIAALPHSPDDLLTRTGHDLLAHPSGRFAAAEAEADSVCDWHPSVPMRLYYARGDEQAVNANTTVCQRALHHNGVDVPTVDLGTPEYAHSRHLGSSVAGARAALRWFEHLRASS